MKKIRFLWLPVLALAIALTGCKSTMADYVPNANENPFIEDSGYVKPEITLDGVMDEAVWEPLQAFSFGDEVKADVKAFYGETGICVGAVVSDPELWAMSSLVYDNSSFEFYLDYSGNGGFRPDSQQMQIFIDVNETSLARSGSGGFWVESSIIKNYAVKVNGTIGTIDPNNSYCVELFIPYTQTGGKPEVDYGIAFGLVGCRENIRQLWIGAPGVNVQSPETYLKLYRDTNSIEYFRKTNSAKLNIDGKADEPEWKNRLEYAFSDGGRGRVTSYMDDRGVYFFMKMRDNQVSASDGEIFLNDSVEIYLDGLCNGGKKPQSDDLQVRVDVNANAEVLRGSSEGIWYSVRNNVFAGAQKVSDGYHVEIFIPWSDLNFEFAPEAMEVCFGSVDWDGQTNKSGHHVTAWSGTGLDPQVPDNYIKMTKDGIAGAVPPAPAAEIRLDGQLNDAQWETAAQHSYRDDQVKVNWFWTDRGCYMAFTVTDSSVATDGVKPYENSSVELYLDYNYSAGKPDGSDRTILVDAAGNMLFRKGVNGAYRDFATSRIFSGVSKTGSGYIVELYMPWVEFGGGMPQIMGVAFGQVTRKPGSNKTTWNDDGYCPDPQNPDLYNDMTATSIGAVAGDPVEEPEIKLDGEFTDTQWQNTASYSYHEDKVKLNWFWTDKGCYFGFNVTDNNVVTNNDKVYKNSSVEIYMDYHMNGGAPEGNDRTILIDAAGNMSFRKGKAGAYREFVTGNILSGVKKTEDGYAVEVFVPWAEFGGERPADIIGIAFGHVTIDAEGKLGWHHDDLCPDPQQPKWYSSFSDKAIG